MDHLKVLRRRKRLTQEALGTLVGVSHQTIVEWEAGTSQPRSVHIPKIAEALDIDTEGLPALLKAAAAEKRRQVLDELGM